MLVADQNLVQAIYSETNASRSLQDLLVDGPRVFSVWAWVAFHYSVLDSRLRSKSPRPQAFHIPHSS